jgi:hypothetical protein
MKTKDEIKEEIRSGEECLLNRAVSGRNNTLHLKINNLLSPGDDLVDIDLHSSPESRSSSPISVLKMLKKQILQFPKLFKKQFSSSSMPNSKDGGMSSSIESIKLNPIADENKANSKSSASISSSSAELSWKRDQEAITEHRFIFHPVFASRYKLLNRVGEGSFGFVWRGERIYDNLKVAVKFIRKSKIPPSSRIGDLPSEVHILQRISHPNIIRFIEYFDDQDYVYLITEMHGISWTLPSSLLSHNSHPQLKSIGHFRRAPKNILVPPCDLFECIEAHSYLPAPLILHIFKQVLAAVEYLHKQGK